MLRTSILAFIIMLMVMLPILALAQDSFYDLVPCATTRSTGNDECDFEDALTLVNRVVNFILYYLAVPIAAVMFAYAGFLMVTAGGESAHSREKAKHIFINVLVGLVIVAGAWLVIKLILDLLGYDGAWIGF